MLTDIKRALRFLSFFLTFLGSLFDLSAHAITYEGGERFGDKMIIYGQARYLSYITSVPLLWKPFLYSDLLTVDYEAKPFAEHQWRYPKKFYIRTGADLKEFFRQIRDSQTPPTLYIYDYKPLDLSEWDRPNTDWAICMNIAWHDPGFADYFRKSCQPKIPIPDLTKPGRLNVADHVRTYSGGDNREGFPLKQTNLAYHKRQIRRIYEYNLKRPMHVFLFTDTKKPLEILEIFKEAFKGDDIVFDVAVHENVDVDYVIQDFFAMQKFDALISTQSSFSMMASCVGDFDMVIYPIHDCGHKPDSELACPWEIDRVRVVSNKSSWFPYVLDVVLKEHY